ncbi:MAG: hypothetical protein IJQ76_07925 [Prevotella sp.]|nr:hypothetical protein [Prevotella sp.]
MERHNNVEKFQHYSKIIAVLYIFAIVSIVMLPFLTTEYGANVLGYKMPLTFVFAAISAIGLVLFAFRFFKNEGQDDTEKIQYFDYKYPAAVAVIALIVFLVADDAIIEEYRNNYESSWNLINGSVSKLAFWWGPFFYCACMAATAYIILMLNDVINDIKKNYE